MRFGSPPPYDPTVALVELLGSYESRARVSHNRLRGPSIEGLSPCGLPAQVGEKTAPRSAAQVIETLRTTNGSLLSVTVILRVPVVVPGMWTTTWPVAGTGTE